VSLTFENLGLFCLFILSDLADFWLDGLSACGTADIVVEISSPAPDTTCTGTGSLGDVLLVLI
jgi:hypothetical protein